MSETLRSSSSAGEIDIFDMAGDSFDTVNSPVQLSPELIRQTIEFFGDQLYEYGSYIGTIADALAGGCPAIQAALVNGGLEGVASLVAGREISQEEADRRRNPEEESKPDEDTQEAAEDDHPNDENTTHDEPKELRPDTKEVTSQSETSADMKPTPLADYQDVQKGGVQTKSMQEVAVDGTDAVTLHDKKNDIPHSDRVHIEPEQTYDRLSIIAEQKNAPSEVSVTMIEQNEATSIDQSVQVGTSVEGESSDGEYLSEPPTRFDAFIEPPVYVSREQASEPMESSVVTDAFQVPTVEPVALDVISERNTREPEDMSIFEALGDESRSSELVEEDENELFALGSNSGIVNALEQPDSTVWQVYEQENTQEQETAIEAVVELATEFIGVEAEFESEVEVAEVRHYIESVAKAVTQLEQATTAEECKKQLEVLEKSLADLLDALGFDGAHDLAKKLVRQYDTKTLRQFIAALLKTVTAGELSHQSIQKKSVPLKHHWFGQRVVERVVRATSATQLQAA
ncbi:hypothetical protein HY312_01180 [Candidatus Saccharibacteria bacterium]|nr:hypothetical protein [Candidatus Saccharibacteria bacterium]